MNLNSYFSGIWDITGRGWIGKPLTVDLKQEEYNANTDIFAKVTKHKYNCKDSLTIKEIASHKNWSICNKKNKTDFIMVELDNHAWFDRGYIGKWWVKWESV